MATSRNDVRVARHASLATLAMCVFLSTSWAGTPATLDESAPPPKPKPTAADTSRKSVRKPATTAAKPGATTKPASTVAQKPTTSTVAQKPGTVPKTGGAKPAVAPVPVAKVAPATPTKSAAATSKTNVTPSKTAVALSKTAVAPSKPATPATKTGQPVPAGIARVAPPPGAGNAKTPPGARSPAAVPGGIARIPAAPGAKAVAVSNTPSVTRLTPSASSKVGSTLAKSGGTTVTGPSVTPIKSGTTGKAGAALGAGVTGGVASKPTPGTKSGSALAQKGGATVSAALEDHVTYQYNALGRRDPFQSLMEGEYVGADVGGQAPPDLGGLKLVGVVWGRSDQFAMVEDPNGGGYVLRRGDRVMNGYVEALKRDAMIVSITVDGQSQSVTIPISRKGDKNAKR